MKKITFILIALLLFNACEEVIDVKVPQSQQRLVIDASINWLKGTSGKEQTVKLTLSTPYFEEKTIPATGAIVTITDNNGTSYDFPEFKNSGIYKCVNFKPIINHQYTISITYKNEVYKGTETLKSVTPIDFIRQRNDGGFTGDQIELKAFYSDPSNAKNYYQFEFYLNNQFNLPITNVYDDEYSNGNQIFAFYTNEDLKIGDTIDIKNYGVSKRYFEFMALLLQQASENSGGPFQTQPATVRGNCINTTNPSNFPFGYFRLSESNEFNYIIKDNTEN